MGRSPCCEKAHTNKGAWTKQEDHRLTHYIRLHGEGCWHSLPKHAGLLRCGKSCRLRWINYLRPDLKRGNFTQEEDELIIKLHSLLGNKWSLIAARLPGRTDNEVKNYWNTHVKRKLISCGIDPQTHRPIAGAGKYSPQKSEIKPSNDQLLISQAIDPKRKEPASARLRPLQLDLPTSRESRTHSVSCYIDLESSCPDSNGGTVCNSGTTDDSQKMGRTAQQMKAQEIDLELSIGLSPFRAGPNNCTIASSAESKEVAGPCKFKPTLVISSSPENMAAPATEGHATSGFFKCIWPLGS